ncbi:uncharacterized protein KIAA1522 homolog isoform X3 [Hippocampus zosterae]|uniref:uncharacterized protein KIAA1522 homolog isoform X3 n=1 Tax=Hippocampus zosterae TaxID=109293 RepID=UPI00223E0AED|nr:uncharacterized protein KIAA1522 homolog isoform X3 [Hippocampus zosterae]
MSRRRSTGDLVPWDVTQIVGREVKAQRGHRKPGSSLGQAISWLRSSQKRKKKTKKGVDSGGKQLVLADGLQTQDAAKAATKANDEQKKLAVHYSASQHFRENVFIEGNRPQYLEDLHSEAQEGLKILQREEHQSGVNFAEDESCASSAHPEDDLDSKDEEGSLESKSNSGISDTTRTSSTMTRPALTRQSSTFKPLYPVKRLEKNKKRNRRTTIMGIPNQVQKELALHRGSTFQQVASTELPNDSSQSGVFIIPSVDGGTPVMTKEGARVHLSQVEQVSDDKQQMKLHLQDLYKKDQAFNHHGYGPHHDWSSVTRPKSVAVPGMTTFTSFNPLRSSFLLEPQGPVMSVSPQATYLSTIIPNAVLPASVEVIEIDRGSQRGNSVHTLSKSSLASEGSSASPFLSRKSESDGSHADISLYNSTTQGTSHKVELNLQGISSLQTPANRISDSENIVPNMVSDPVLPCSSGNDAKIKRHSTRSLSIIKTKLPPAPPRRSNSLHSNKIQTDSKGQAQSRDANVSASQGGSSATGSRATTEESQVTAETNKILDPVSNIAESNCHPLSPAQVSAGGAKKAGESISELNPSFPQKNHSECEKFERTISPSSGYSSQSGTPTLSPKEITPISPDKHKTKPVKPERTGSRASSSASPSSSLTSLSSGTSEPVNLDVSNSCTSNLPPASAKDLTSPLRMEVRDLWNVPPPPKIKAPCPPPPETWAQNSHAVALLCGPSPQITKLVTESTKTRENADMHEGSQTETRDLSFEKQSQDETEASKINSTDDKSSCDVAGEVHRVKENTERAGTEEDTFSAEDRIEKTTKTQDQESCRWTMTGSGSCDVSVKKEPPPVMKKPQPGGETTLTESQQSDRCKIAAISAISEVDTSEVRSIRANSIDSQSFRISSPPPSPPPAYQPTPPLSRKSPPTSVSVSLDELERVQEENCVAESSWPPPPPPLEGDSVLDGGDEIEFPLPPPPDVAYNIPAEDACARGLEVSDTPIPSLEEFVKTIQDSGEAETSAPPDPVLVQTVVCDNKDAESSDGPVRTLSSALQGPSFSTGNPAEIQPLLSAIASGSFPKRRSLEIESHPATESPGTSQLPALVKSPSPMENLTAGVAFRRPPGTAHRDNRTKELLARHKSAPIPKEDANIPLVTPSLLHMVRLRTVSTNEDSAEALSEDGSPKEVALVEEIGRTASVGQQNTPPKPTRKSLKSPPQAVKTYVTPNTPSMRLQEAIRIKTAALSSREGLPYRLGMRPSYHCASEPGILSHKSSEALDTQRIPASSASFIFSRSAKQVVIDTGATPEDRAGVKQSLAGDLVRSSDQTNAAVSSSSGLRSERVPPPVARKPSHGGVSFSQQRPACSARMDSGASGTEATTAQHSKGTALPETTTRVTADTIETLF